MAKLESYINNILLNIMLYFTIIILASIWVPSYGQRIRLFQYRQEDSETNCTHGLISDVDTVVFKAEVDLSGLNNMRYVYFQLKSKSDSHFTTFKSIVINGSVAEKYSWEIIRPQVAQITIKDKAKTEYSFASIRGIVVTSDFKEVISDQQIFPEIRESTDIKISLLTNGVETPIQNNVCDIRVTEANIVIIFECQSQTVPCLIEISATDLMTPLLGKGYVLHTSKMPELNITIKYATCTFHGKINEINCRIKHDDILETIVTKKEFNTYTVHILYGAAITISVIFNIGFLIPLLWKSNRLRFLKVLCCIKSKKEYSFSGNNFIKVTQVKEFSDKTKKLLNNIDLAKDEKLLSTIINLDTSSAANDGVVERFQEFINNNPWCINNQCDEGYTFLMHSSMKGNVQLAKLLIDKEANIFIKDRKGMTALMISCAKGHDKIVKMLIDRLSSIKGINILVENQLTNVKNFINDTNHEGMTPLILASRGCHESCVNLLINYKAEVDLKDKYGYTALMYACQYGYKLIALSLIRGHADVNMKSPKRGTSLMLASCNGHYEIVKLLVKYKALVDERDDRGYTALDWALIKNECKIIELLRNKKANQTFI